MASISSSRSDRPSNCTLPSTSKTWPPSALARLRQLFEQPAVDVAFARFLGDEVPEMADLGLADAVNASEPLFEPVRVPRQVVVHHQMGALEIDAFAGGVGRQQDLHFGIVPEGFLRLHALLAAHAAVDDDDRLIPAEQRPDPRCAGSSACRGAR